MEDVILEDLDERFGKTYEALRRDLSRVRTGRANANILDTIRVVYYGQPTPLNQVATVQVPEARLITIKPFDNSLLRDIERTILSSDLGLTPNNDGTVIRLSIPPLTEERRKTLVKQVKQIGEEAKVAARNARRDANNQLRDLQKGGDLTEDELDRALKSVQTRLDDAVKHIDEVIGHKERELLEI